MLEESEFERRASAMLKRIESALEAAEVDFDAGAGVIEIDMDDGGKIIVNRHNAAREIWVAARSGGYHFRPEITGERERWLATRDGEELFAALTRCIREQGGASVSLA